jgi:hypothetical protein
MTLLFHTQGMADLFIRRRVVGFCPLAISVFIEPSKKPCSGALDLLNNVTNNGSLLFATRCPIDFTMPVDDYVKIEISMVLHDVKATSTDDIPRTSRYWNQGLFRSVRGAAINAGGTT